MIFFSTGLVRHIFESRRRLTTQNLPGKVLNQAGQFYVIILKSHLIFTDQTPLSKIMKRTLCALSLLVFCFSIQAQPLIKNKKYPSLLWEITGKGLKKPSYLFGTMHVSSKMAFNLADSFYIGIRNADVVALETNPESWQEDMSKYDVGEDMYGRRSLLGDWRAIPNDYLTISTLRFRKYERLIQSALYSSPSVINNLLYRTYGNDASDFEEDTYLDMYIYQCGKRWGKRVAGVESYGESMKLMMEAYRDAAKEKNKKERSYDYDESLSPAKLQEAYRTGNLDLLDSINRVNSYSDAFDEKFLYKRNEIQANSIDSILRTNLSLFVGVGAAHLPGQRGVIELLRKMGYKVRSVKMGVRNSDYKNTVEKIRVPVTFSTQTAADGFYKVDVPGKLYQFDTEGANKQQQYADMANGSYYMVTRLPLSAWMWGHSNEDVYRKIDSLLYENVPGKIISKTTGTKNGYTMIDLTNKTRRGDIQRYNIIVTPFEVIFFKMSGTGDYVMKGEEAKRFFGSIQLKEFKAQAGWKKFSPAYGGFTVSLPHEPYIGDNGNWLFDAADKNTQTQYRVIRTDIHNYGFAEEDTFDLSLMEESFAASEFIDSLISRRQTTVKGYPALDCKYADKTGGVLLTRYLIQGPHYYTLIARGRQETQQMQQFLNSFEIKPYQYGPAKERVDTALYFTVKSPVFPEDKKEKLGLGSYKGLYGDDDESEESILEEGTYRNKVISNDTTGEKIYVAMYKSPRYYYSKDSSMLENEYNAAPGNDSSWIVRSKKKYTLPNKMKVWEINVSDTGSSRMVMVKTFYKEGTAFTLLTETDTLTQPSSFIKGFFESFVPADTLKGYNPFVKKSALFFEDFRSLDTVKHKRAVKNIYSVQLDGDDLKPLQQLIGSLTWKEKKYLDTKKALIGKIDDMQQKEATDYLRQLYHATNDTVELQYHILKTLLRQKTQYAFQAFRDIVLNEPPVLDLTSYNSTSYSLESITTTTVRRGNSYGDGGFMDELYDSLKLTRTILPDLLPLLNLDDYQSPLMGLLKVMVDSNLVKPKEYESFSAKFLLEAKQELKRQAILEKKRLIEKAEEDKEADDKITELYSYGDRNQDKDTGNDDLILYGTLLLPYWDKNPQVPVLLNQMLGSSDKKLKYATLLLLIKNKKSYPDSLLIFFAQSDEYRYTLYTDLRLINQEKLFPKAYNNHLALARSSLLASKSYGKPDTLVYLDRLKADVKGRQGYVYFFKYKSKKDDLTWKLATAGLIPLDSMKFEFDEPVAVKENDYSYEESENSSAFTEFSDVKIKDEDEEPLNKQLQQHLKKALYSLRKSARQFYGYGGYDYDLTVPVKPDYGD